VGEPRAGAGKTQKPQNKLSGGNNELLPDIRTPGAAVGSDPAMATVGSGRRRRKVRPRPAGTPTRAHAGDAAGTGATAATARRSIEAHRVRPGRGQAG
jgi:hypothetical protein